MRLSAPLVVPPDETRSDCFRIMPVKATDCMEYGMVCQRGGKPCVQTTPISPRAVGSGSAGGPINSNQHNQFVQ